MKQDTIFALSTAKGKAGIAIIRLSGDKSLDLAKVLVGARDLQPNNMQLAHIAYKGDHIDNGMVVYFKAPNSFTGEDVIEFHLHGSSAIIEKLTRILLDLGARYAGAGEFSRRAYLNGKMDLTSIEGLDDLINAQTEAQLKHSLRHMSGEFAKLCDSWREKLLKSQSLTEAYLDFPEEDIPEEVIEQSDAFRLELIESLEKMLSDKRKGEVLRSGIALAVLGEPNVGKSTMLNYLSKRDVAIISDIAGTTRDILETHIDIGGYPFILSDTAGIRETEDVIESEGVSRAMALAQNADIKLIMLDANNPQIPDSLRELLGENTLLVANKIDLLDKNVTEGIDGHKIIPISLKSAEGMDNLLSNLTRLAGEVASIGDEVVITRTRHRKHIQNALDALKGCDLRGDLVLAAEDLRIAAKELSSLTGVIDTEEILGEIFSNFCIGK